ncbi:glucosamine--fructose-6-phosphate aminotransferase [Fodinicola feengrottensis]|uniref:Glutamine--fructose-6-phosphate aminotransferase [isomerizing] n=1 Tax=Fodinicola feengrottensis TaxID=435914 RepID=A0ABP4U315_9ACTN
MDYYQAVASQAANLERSANIVREQLGALDLSRWQLGVLAVASMGASSHAGHALVHRLGRYGRRAINVDASEILALGPKSDVADGYVFVSEGGRSRETIAAAQQIGGNERLGITNDPTAPLSQVVDATFGIGHGEDSRVYTVGYTATLQAFGLLATALDGICDGDDWPALPALVDRTLTDLAVQAFEIADALTEVTSIDVVGAGLARASASESALLIRESTRISTAAYETYQFLHGPMEALTRQRACVLFGEEREVRLARYLAAAKVPTVLVTSATVAAAKNLHVVPIPAVSGLSRAILQILPIQLLAGDLARRFGLKVNGFQHTQDDTKIDHV